MNPNRRYVCESTNSTADINFPKVQLNSLKLQLNYDQPNINFIKLLLTISWNVLSKNSVLQIPSTFFALMAYLFKSTRISYGTFFPRDVAAYSSENDEVG